MTRFYVVIVQKYILYRSTCLHFLAWFGWGVLENTSWQLKVSLQEINWIIRLLCDWRSLCENCWILFSGDRTFGVLTKIDLMDKGTDASEVSTFSSLNTKKCWPPCWKAYLPQEFVSSLDGVLWKNSLHKSDFVDSNMCSRYSYNRRLRRICVFDRHSPDDTCQTLQTDSPKWLCFLFFDSPKTLLGHFFRYNHSENNTINCFQKMRNKKKLLKVI